MSPVVSIRPVLCSFPRTMWYLEAPCVYYKNHHLLMLTAVPNLRVKSKDRRDETDEQAPSAGKNLKLCSVRFMIDVWLHHNIHQRNEKLNFFVEYFESDGDELLQSIWLNLQFYNTNLWLHAVPFYMNQSPLRRRYHPPFLTIFDVPIGFLFNFCFKDVSVIA